jgi:hypothetical protein
MPNVQNQHAIIIMNLAIFSHNIGLEKKIVFFEKIKNKKSYEKHALVKLLSALQQYAHIIL